MIRLIIQPNGRQVPPDHRGGSEVSSSRQAEIVAAAIALFQEKGYHATSMQDIANAVGLQKGSLYHYITGKQDLLAMIYQGVISQYNNRLSEIRQLPLPAGQRIEMAIRQHIRIIAEHLGMLTIFLRESYALSPGQRALVQAEISRYNQMFEELYAEGVQSGEVRDLDPKLVTRTVLGACNWLYRWYRPDGKRSIDELADFMVDVLLNGIRVGPPAA